MADDFEAKDLLGDPLRPLPDKRGRRKLRFPAEVYETVEVLAAAGELSQDDIADAIGVSAPSLRKYFRPELVRGLARQKARALSLLAKAAEKGNVSAIKAYMAELDKRGAAAALKERERPAPRAAAKGKKEERQEAAASVASGGGKYAPGAPPRRIN